LQNRSQGQKTAELETFPTTSTQKAFNCGKSAVELLKPSINVRSRGGNRETQMDVPPVR